MREDMHKVIVERPRSGRWAKRCRNRFAGHDDLPTKIGARRHARLTHTHSRFSSDHLQPLRRYLAKQVDRPWAKVYSDICANLHPRHTVKQHVLEHLEQFVAHRLGVGRDGELLDQFGNPHTWTQDLYVDPNDGILKDSAKYWRKRGIDPKPWKRKRGVAEADPDVVRLAADMELHRLDGFWFAVKFRDEPLRPGDTHVYDVIRKGMIPAGQRYAAEKRQLSAGFLKEFELKNDNQIEDGAKPQRHKRKRRKT
ncbi:hypothetical protein [Pelagibius sp.]|uniref:hypothetical protein n=1 Tax=Pelagibius sp. TaxID=1931238 RepID=UPI002639090B|nr:hypothetical protein [Pelagibius sp.]